MNKRKAISGSEPAAENRLEDGDYKPDFELLDRYQAFSAELLRIALLVLTGIGLAISSEHTPLQVIMKKFPDDPMLGLLFVTGLVGTVLSIIASLYHRYVSSDSMAYYLEMRRWPLRYERAKKGLHLALYRARIAIVVAPSALGVGITFVGIAFILAWLSAWR